MKLELRTFQEDAVRELLSRMRVAQIGYQQSGLLAAVGLSATTGAGKTVIATALIEAMLYGSEEFGVTGDDNAVFLWMTDMPELNLQTQEKMYVASSELTYELLSIVEPSFNEDTLSPGRVYFLNTQKLAARSDLVKTGPLVQRTFTFWDIVDRTIESGRMLYLVVDEAHRGMTESRKIAEANSIIQRFIKGYEDGPMRPVPVVLGISATPERYNEVVRNSGRSTSQWDVPAEDVRNSGLIKERTLADYAAERQTDAMALFPEAVKAWWEATQAWERYHANYPSLEEPLVVPALVVQVENEEGGRVTRTDLGAVITAITDVAGPLPDTAFAHAFGEGQPEPVGERVIRYLEPSKIAADPEARIIFFKTSLGTGWDCPRAEVLFSFRRAVDATSIAQTIGRMVRTPLARRIDENDALNAAHVFLPHYNKQAVEEVVAKLDESGNAAIAGTIQDRRESILLPLREDLSAAVEAIQKVPSNLVPTRVRRQDIRILADLAYFISSHGLDPDAFATEMTACADVLLRRREALAEDNAFVNEVDDQGVITVEEAEITAGINELVATGTKQLAATAESISRVYAIAERRLTGEVAKRYVRMRLGQDPTVLAQAQLEAYALSGRTAVMDELNHHALSRLDALRPAHGAEIEGLPPRDQQRYWHILRQAPNPSPKAIVLPSVAAFVKGDEALAKHVYADAEGQAVIKLNTWELDTIRDEIAKPDTIGWLRVVDRAEWALTVPRLEGTTWRPFYPDFVVVREDPDHGLVVDVVDPHDHTKPDAVSKAKGLSDYADKHAEHVGHVDLVAKVDGHYRRLHLDRAQVRNEVNSITTHAELKRLYLQLG